MPDHFTRLAAKINWIFRNADERQCASRIGTFARMHCGKRTRKVSINFQKPALTAGRVAAMLQNY
jgi:hypothetical protein